MKKKNIILTIAIIICTLACILLLLVNVFGLNIINHEDIQIGEFSIEYYGDFTSVNTVKVYQGSIRRGTFELNVGENILNKINEYPPYFDDLNNDGHNDLLISHAFDKNNSPRYAVYMWNNESKMFEESEELLDVANLNNDDNGKLHSFVSIHKTIYPADKNVPEVYEEHKISTEYKLVDGSFRLVKNYTLIYYSETDAYCYAMIDYNPQNGEVISFVEDWMSEKEASEIQFYNQK